MKILEREDLYSLEEYAARRADFRQTVMAAKKNRFVVLGENVRMIFENRLTIHYQIQEMLRAEKIFESAEIQEELDAYNPLIPDGKNLKATMMIEFSNPEVRRAALQKMLGIERAVFFQVGSGERIFAVADEDLSRETEDKTSAVHFMRFEFSPPMIDDFVAAGQVLLAVEHPNYQAECVLSKSVQSALAADFD